MTKKKLLGFLLVPVIIIVAFTIVYKGNTNFDPGDRYVSTNLNYMGSIFASFSDAIDMNNGFSTTSSCPWGYVHRGYDVFFVNNSNVIAATPGQVTTLELFDFGEGYEYRYSVKLMIRYNQTIYVEYHFECWTDDWANYTYQRNQISVNLGDWVQKGDILGKMVNYNPGAHIHHGVIENSVSVCMDKFYDTAGYNIMLDYIHRNNPAWAFSYC